MTMKLYWQDDLLEAMVTVLSCTQRPDGRYLVFLDASPFHPQGGGQPSDIGYIDDIPMLYASMKDGVITHLCENMLTLGKHVAKVNEQERNLHSRLHSAGHIIGHVMERLGWQPVEAHHRVDDARVVFQVSTENHELPAVADLECLCHEFIASDVKRKVEIDSNGFRYVAFGDCHPYGCGGTHVKSTKEIGEVKITAIAIKKNRLTISYAL